MLGACDRCGEPLDEPGGVLFGFRDTERTVRRRSLCVPCYQAVESFLADHEDNEDRLEIARHHRDFGRIADLVERALAGEMDEREAHRAIHAIVG